MSLSGQKIILGISGSIAAYKSALLARLMIKAGAEVQVIMTPSASHFISPLTISTLTGREVHTDLWEDNQWNNHVNIALWADMMVFAPLTANSLAKMAHGQVDNLLLATYLSAKCPIYFAPAMDLDMWRHPSTQHNVKTLQSYGCHYIPVGEGHLASGLSGPGRMAEPEDIVRYLGEQVLQQQSLAGHTAIVTAGPTREHLDPVRFLSNPSTGRMGMELANLLAKHGAKVHLILGPTQYQRDMPSQVQIHHVTSAHDMFLACKELHPMCTIAIFAAAVADYTFETTSQHKLKKKNDDLSLQLQRTIDIAGHLGQEKKNQIHVGFALETQNETQNALKKIKSKNFDFIVLNSLSDTGAGFGVDTNKISILHSDNKRSDFELKDKAEVAKDIIDAILSMVNSQTTEPLE